MDDDSEETKSWLEPKSGGENRKRQITVNLKTAIIIVVIIIVGALAYRYKGLVIAAKVNGSFISRFSVIKELEKRSGKAALDTLITQKLIDAEAQKKGIVVNGDDVSEEIKKIEDQIKANGKTLDEVLIEQGMTRSDLESQIIIQKKLEKLLTDKIQVTDAEIEKFIADNKVGIPKGEEETYKNQARSQLQQNKLSEATGAFIESLRSKVSISYFTNY